MKTHYILGKPTKNFVRLYSDFDVLGCSLTLEEAEDAKKIIKNAKIYKLVEVKK